MSGKPMSVRRCCKAVLAGDSCSMMAEATVGEFFMQFGIVIGPQSEVCENYLVPMYIVTTQVLRLKAED